MSTCYGPTIKWPSFSVLLAPSISPTPLVLKSQPGSSKILNPQVANLSYNLMSSGLHQDPQPTKILNHPIANNAIAYNSKISMSPNLVQVLLTSHVDLATIR